MGENTGRKVERMEYIPPNRYMPDLPKKGAGDWGSTYGAIQGAVTRLVNDGHTVAHAHLRYIKPFPKNLEELMRSFDHVLVPEINNGHGQSDPRPFPHSAIPFQQDGAMQNCRQPSWILMVVIYYES